MHRVSDPRNLRATSGSVVERSVCPVLQSAPDEIDTLGDCVRLALRVLLVEGEARCTFMARDPYDVSNKRQGGTLSRVAMNALAGIQAAQFEHHALRHRK